MTVNPAYEYFLATVGEFKAQQTSIEEQHLSPMTKDALLFTALVKANELVNLYVRALASCAETEFSPIPFVQVSRKENTAKIMRMWQKRLSIPHTSNDSRLESLIHFLIKEVNLSFEEDYYGSSEPSIGYQSARNGLEGVRVFLEYINRLGWGSTQINVGKIRHGFSDFPTTSVTP